MLSSTLAINNEMVMITGRTEDRNHKIRRPRKVLIDRAKD